MTRHSYRVGIRTCSDYSPFGVELDGRTVSGGYRYGYQGSEKDNETKGKGNSNTTEFRQLDPRLGRWLSRDAHESKYPAVSSYVYGLNSPLMFMDNDGNDAIVTVQQNPQGGGTITISSVVYITGKAASPEKALEFTEKAAMVYKSGTFTKGDNQYTINFDVQFKYVEDGSKINLQRGENMLEMTGEEGRSYVLSKKITQKDTYGNVLWVKHTTGTIGKIRNIGNFESYSVLHETLHLIGLTDRYTETKEAFSTNIGFTQDIMGSSNSSDIGQTHYDNYGKDYSSKASGTYLLNERVDIDKKGNLEGGNDLQTISKFDLRDFMPDAKKEEANRVYGPK